MVNGRAPIEDVKPKERSPLSPETQAARQVEEHTNIVVRFAGDSGDGMQITGSQFTSTNAVFGNDLATLPDYPAEIRAPQGTLAGVSGFQINFGSQKIYTAGDQPDVFVCMNPAALKVNMADLPGGCVIIANEDAFSERNLKMAGFNASPLQDGTLSKYRVYPVKISTLTNEALKEVDMSAKDKARCKNFFALGLIYWMFNRSPEQTMRFLHEKFSKKPVILEANEKALRAGMNYGETAEAFTVKYEVKEAELSPGKYRNITGNSAMAIGMVAASKLAGVPMFLGSYPITPASDILHELSRFKNYGIMTFQAEDEIAAICSTIGAAYAGYLGLTTTSGPGVALKGEAIGLAVMTELPIIIVNVQRGGPSTGLPTKTEQADLLQAMYGRNGECPVAIVAPSTPADCFNVAIEAVRIATKYMMPVMILSDGYLANGAEAWKLPEIKDLPKLDVKFHTNPEGFKPYMRDDNLSRPWVKPGTPGLEHRVGGIEKQNLTGNVNYEAKNHEFMVKLRAQKVANIAKDVPPVKINGDATGDMLVLGWGSTYGSITAAVDELRQQGKKVSSAHLRHMNPFPANLGEVLKGFKKVLVPEMNNGQLVKIIRSEFMIPAIPHNKIQGQPFRKREIVDGILANL